MKSEEEIVSKSVPDYNPFENANRFSFDPTPHFVKQTKEASKQKKRSKSKKKKTKQITKEYVSSPISVEDQAVQIQTREDQIKYYDNELAKLKAVAEAQLVAKQDSYSRRVLNTGPKFDSAPTVPEDDVRIRMSLVTSGSSQFNSANPYALSFANKIDPVTTTLISQPETDAYKRAIFK